MYLKKIIYITKMKIMVYYMAITVLLSEIFLTKRQCQKKLI